MHYMMLADADIDDLLTIEGIGRKTAEALFAYFPKVYVYANCPYWDNENVDYPTIWLVDTQPKIRRQNDGLRQAGLNFHHDLINQVFKEFNIHDS